MSESSNDAIQSNEDIKSVSDDSNIENVQYVWMT